MEQKEHGGRLRCAVRAAFPHTVPVLTGFLVLGTAYGVVMQTKGYGGVWPVIMSAVAFCGSMQFAAIPLLGAAFDPVQAFALSFMVNARQLFYGIAMLDKYRGLGKARPFLIYTLCDETFSIASGTAPPCGVPRRDFYLAISALDYSYWVLGTLCGALLGRAVSFNTAGLDFVLTALFAVLFTEQCSTRAGLRSGLAGIGCTAAALAAFGADRMVLPAMALLLLVLLAGRKKQWF